MNQAYSELAQTLSDLLNLQNPPLAITFSDKPPAGIEAYDAPMPDPTDDGRTGRVPAGCVFWVKAEKRTFTTRAEDHGNCSVGSLTQLVIVKLLQNCADPHWSDPRHQALCWKP